MKYINGKQSASTYKYCMNQIKQHKTFTHACMGVCRLVFTAANSSCISTSRKFFHSSLFCYSLGIITFLHTDQSLDEFQPSWPFSVSLQPSRCYIPCLLPQVSLCLPLYSVTYVLFHPQAVTEASCVCDIWEVVHQDL